MGLVRGHGDQINLMLAESFCQCLPVLGQHLQLALPDHRRIEHQVILL